MLLANQYGWPDAVPVRSAMKPFEYMNGWNWSTPSSSHINPSAVWKMRRLSEAK
jgi:hypothetical protein